VLIIYDFGAHSGLEYVEKLENGKKKLFSIGVYLSLLYIVMKIVAANPVIPAMTSEEAERFLESKLNLQLATIDEKGDPNIQPVWFYYDKGKGKLLIITSKLSKKTQNLKIRPTIYFSIDDQSPPYKGVKGKGNATIVEEPNRIVPQAEKISMKYLGSLDHPSAKEMVDRSKNGEGILVGNSPKFFSTWDFGKSR
jgi:nitroimidazol reductase NimA-like FMN-containing flavoprotein (pyridoxamine 5'-phosphate oxidase superfamily)